jgi:hypothetical protein
MSVTTPADCEVRSVIRFLNANNICPAEICRQLDEVYKEIVMNEGKIGVICLMEEGNMCVMKRGLDARVIT